MAAGNATIDRETTIDGTLTNGGVIEVFGLIRGSIATERLIVRQGGRVTGNITANTALVEGRFEGDARIKDLIEIAASGEAIGRIRYGKLGLEAGGLLEANVRNLPPELAGDMDVSVDKGGIVRLTPLDLRAFDPDDDAKALTFRADEFENGWLCDALQRDMRLTTFTQADLDAGRVVFMHDGSGSPTAGFKVFVEDDDGARSGAPRQVNVAVLGASG